MSPKVDLCSWSIFLPTYKPLSLRVSTEMLLRSCRIGFHLSTDGVKGYVMSCIMNKPNHPRSFLCTDAQRNFLLPSNDPDIDPGIKGMAVSFSYIIYNTGRILYRDFSGQEQEHQRTTNIMGITYISQNSWISTPTKHRSWLIFFFLLALIPCYFRPGWCRPWWEARELYGWIPHFSRMPRLAVLRVVMCCAWHRSWTTSKSLAPRAVAADCSWSISLPSFFFLFDNAIRIGNSLSRI